MSLEDKVRAVFKKVLDIEPSEIKPAEKLNESLGIDSTELVEISVALKKEFAVALGDGEIKKTHSFNDIVSLLTTRGAQ